MSQEYTQTESSEEQNLNTNNADQSNDTLESEGSDTKWKEGDDITFVRVRFPGNSKSFPFLKGKRTFSYGQKVVAMSDRGMDVGYINSFPYTVKFKKDMLPVRSISKVADQSDIEAMQGNIDEQKRAESKASEIIDKLGLDMQITHVEIIQFGKKMVFYFTAPSRVDFRELVKQLVSHLKMRIELRQISVRDRAAALGSIGSCGLATCCSTFLKNYGNVTIKMAKNQNLALIPSKINGVCGQIKCCIKYEDNVYADKRKKLPREGSFLKVVNGDIGKVTKLHILVEQFDMITEKGQIRRYAKTQFTNGKNLGKDYNFPQSFKHVVNETSDVIGLSDVENEMADNFQKGLSDHEKAMANIQALSNDENIVKSDDKTPSENTEAKENESAPKEAKSTEESGQRNNRNKRRRPRKNNRPKSDANSSAQAGNAKDSGNKENNGQENNKEKKKNNRNRRNRRPRNNKPKDGANKDGGKKENS